MSNKDMFDKAFPQDKQIGGSHYKDFPIQPYEFISKNNLSFFQGNVVKYVCKEGDASVEYQHFMKVILQDGNIRNSSHLVHKVMMHLLGHRDKSAQEVLFTATGGKYYSM